MSTCFAERGEAPACTHSDCHDDQRSDRCAPVDHRLVHQRIEPPLLLPGAACSGGGRGHPGDLVPDGEAVGHLVAPSGGRQQMPSRTEMWRDAAERGQEPLRMPGRGEPFHRPLALPGQLMRGLGPIVQILRLPVFHRGHHHAVGGPLNWRACR